MSYEVVEMSAGRISPLRRIGLALILAAAGQTALGCGGKTVDQGGFNAATVVSDAGSAPDAGAQPTGVPVLGAGGHISSSVKLDVIAASPEGLSSPRDIGIHPQTGDLWVVNQADNSVVILSKPGTPAQTAAKKSGPGSEHFMSKPVALAFGAPGFLATAHEEDEVTQSTTPADFMGPSLWTSAASFEGGYASHVDMLHNSPNATGIAWERDNVYWVFDGFHASVTRYDFGQDHGLGGTDHSDGVITRYVEGLVRYQPDVSSHLEMDRTTGLLYVADTGNNRIAVLDTKSGTVGSAVTPDYDGVTQNRRNAAVLTTLVNGPDVGLFAPSGIALRDGVLYVSSNATSTLYAFSLQGAMLDYLTLDPVFTGGGLMGIDFDAAGRLYVVDTKGSRVIRVSPL